MNVIDNLWNEDPDTVIEISYNILIDSRYPLPLALIETIADCPIICRLTTVEKSETTITYALHFKGKVIDLCFLNSTINLWLKDHKIGLLDSNNNPVL